MLAGELSLPRLNTRHQDYTPQRCGGPLRCLVRVRGLRLAGALLRPPVLPPIPCCVPRSVGYGCASRLGWPGLQRVLRPLVDGVVGPCYHALVLYFVVNYVAAQPPFVAAVLHGACHASWGAEVRRGCGCIRGPSSCPMSTGVWALGTSHFAAVRSGRATLREFRGCVVSWLPQSARVPRREGWPGGRAL